MFPEGPWLRLSRGVSARVSDCEPNLLASPIDLNDQRNACRSAEREHARIRPPVRRRRVAAQDANRRSATDAKPRPPGGRHDEVDRCPAVTDEETGLCYELERPQARAPNRLGHAILSRKRNPTEKHTLATSGRSRRADLNCLVAADRDARPTGLARQSRSCEYADSRARVEQRPRQSCESRLDYTTQSDAVPAKGTG